MAAVVVTVTPRKGKPRQIHVDDFRANDGAEIRRGASLIETLKRQERRGELLSVVVEPEPTPLPPAAGRAAKKAVPARKAVGPDSA